MRISRIKSVFLDGEDARLHPELTFLWSLVCSQELVIRGDKEPPEIARILGIHPYVLGGTNHAFLKVFKNRRIIMANHWPSPSLKYLKAGSKTLRFGWVLV